MIFKQQKFSLGVLLSFCLIFCQFQAGVAYESVAYKNACIAASSICKVLKLFSETSKIAESVKKLKVYAQSVLTVLFWFRSSTFYTTKIDLNNDLSPIFCTCSIFSLAWFCNILQMDVASKPYLSDAFTASLSMVFYQYHVYTHHHKPRTTKKTLVLLVSLNVNWFLRFSV